MKLDEVLPTIRQLTVPEKLKLIRILAEDLDTDEDIFPFEHYRVYHLPTPYDSFGAAQELANAVADTHRNNALCAFSFPA